MIAFSIFARQASKS